MAVASDGQSIYLAAASALGGAEGQSNDGGEMNRPLLWRVDAASGEKRPFPDTDQQRQCMFGRYLSGSRIVTDVAVLGGKVYLTAPAQDTLFVADARTGRQLAAWPVPQVSGVAADARGRLLVGSGSKIVALDAAGRPERTLADAGGPSGTSRPCPAADSWPASRRPAAGCVLRRCRPGAAGPGPAGRTPQVRQDDRRCVPRSGRPVRDE